MISGLFTTLRVALRSIPSTIVKLKTSRAGKWISTALDVSSWGYIFYDLFLSDEQQSVASSPFGIIPMPAKVALLLDQCPPSLTVVMSAEGMAVLTKQEDAGLMLLGISLYLQRYPSISDLAYSSEDLAEGLESIVDALDKNKAVSSDVKAEASRLSSTDVDAMDAATRRLSDALLFTLKTIEND